MKKVVNILGLDCPNCAATLEREINKIEGIENAKIDFLKSKLTYESSDLELALDKIVRLTKQLEPQVKITTLDKNFVNKSFLIDLVGLGLGIVFAILCFSIRLDKFYFLLLLVILYLCYLSKI